MMIDESEAKSPTPRRREAVLYVRLLERAITRARNKMASNAATKGEKYKSAMKIVIQTDHSDLII